MFVRYPLQQGKKVNLIYKIYMYFLRVSLISFLATPLFLEGFITAQFVVWKRLIELIKIIYHEVASKLPYRVILFCLICINCYKRRAICNYMNISKNLQDRHSYSPRGVSVLIGSTVSRKILLTNWLVCSLNDIIQTSASD